VDEEKGVDLVLHSLVRAVSTGHRVEEDQRGPQKRPSENEQAAKAPLARGALGAWPVLVRPRSFLEQSECRALLGERLTIGARRWPDW
jgi:hypothetical protein